MQGVFADLRALADPRCPWNNQVAVQGPILLCREKMVLVYFSGPEQLEVKSVLLTRRGIANAALAMCVLV